ncbi:MAG: hypothetical protein GH148_01900 [Clostridia bacterium]|nr:hypothetical protein [Clostridia bacterium]
MAGIGVGIYKLFQEAIGNSIKIKEEIFSDDAGQSIPSLQSVRGVKLLTNRKDLQKARRLLDKKNLSNE